MSKNKTRGRHIMKLETRKEGDSMDWKSRVKSVSFWVSIALAIATPILAYMGLTASDITTWSKLGEVVLNAISNPYIIGLVVVSVWNAINNPTTAGLSDSLTSNTSITTSTTEKENTNE